MAENIRRRGVAASIAAPRDLPPGCAHVQWRVENQEEVARFLEDHMVRIKPIPGDQLLIQGAFTGADIQVSPGDVLVLHNDKIGVIRVPESAKFRESDNPDDFAPGTAGHMADDFTKH